MSFYMAFGLDVEGYRSAFASYISLLQLLLGIFDYDELWRSNRAVSARATRPHVSAVTIRNDSVNNSAPRHRP